MAPEPIVPDYAGANVRGIVPALLGPHGWSSGLPPWMPPVLAGADQIVLLVLDGLGWDQLQDRRDLAPTLAGLDGGRITTVAPTTTATALSSIATGLTPGEHGLIGYRIVIGGEVVNVLRWSCGGEDRRRTYPPADIQRFPAFLGEPVPVVTPLELCGSAFGDAHLRGSRSIGWRASSSMPLDVRALLDDGERFVYSYYGGIDRVAHERGFGPYFDAELRHADRLVADLLDLLPSGAALAITSDHGQVHVGDHVVQPSRELLSLCSLQSGEGRFRWLHAKRGAADELLAAARDELGHLAWVRTRDELVDAGWFGPTVAPDVAHRLGDVALVAHEPVSFHDPDDTGPFELVCRHGSMTAAEVYVPLLAGMRG